MICLDTPILIWGVRESATRGQEHMIDKASRYIAYLESQNERIMVPTPVIAEYLVGATVTQRRDRVILERGFYAPGFDLPSAELAAELLRDTDLIKRTRDETGVDRLLIKIDAQIIAIAITHHAKKIVTPNVRHFRVLARGKIDIEDLPDILEQNRLPLITD